MSGKEEDRNRVGGLSFSLPELVYQVKDLILFEFGIFLAQFDSLHRNLSDAL